jgi:peptidoglycan/LPS O-acetylase OafA/YrhL
MEKNHIGSKSYLPNLDGLRCIACLIIIILHIEGIKSHQDRERYDILTYYMNVGNIDVSLFFVLSGFLITYLLLKEKKENGFINLKAYYARRTLRIWPLYYLIVILGFFAWPHFDNSVFNNVYSANAHKHFWLSFIGSFLFLSPLVSAVSGLPQSIGPIWSVGVEEVFYLCWPLFLRKTRKYVLLFFAIVILVIVARNGFFLYHHFFNWDDSDNTIFRGIRYLLMQYRISCMAIGAIGAYLVVFDKKKILAILYRKDFQWIIYVITISFLLLRIGLKPIARENFPSIFHEVYSILFAIIIVNLATNPQSVIRLDYKWMNYLGKISYGLYMYHPVMRIFSLEVTECLFKRETSGWQMNGCLYFFTISSTIIISILSYEFFEKYFLNLKTKFTKQRL